MRCAVLAFAVCFSGPVSGQLQLVKEINPGRASSLPDNFVSFRGKAYFVATNPSSGREIWCSDGTAAGTKLAIDVWAGSGSSNPSALGVLGDKLVFVARTLATGTELFVSGGTTATTTLLKDIVPGRGTGVGGGSPYFSKPIGGYLYFPAGLSGNELWRTNGKPSGTQKVGSFSRRVWGAFGELPKRRGSFLFGVYTRLHRYDSATNTSTDLGQVVYPSFGTEPGVPFLEWQGKLVFSGASYMPFITDGTKVGTKRLFSANIRLTAIRPASDGLIGSDYATGYLYAWNATSGRWTRLPRVGRLTLGVQAGRHYTYFSGGNRLRNRGGVARTDGTASGTKILTRQSIYSVGVRMGSNALYGAWTSSSRGYELYSLKFSAAAWKHGNGCGTLTRKPTMTATDPVLGHNQAVSFQNIQTGRVAVMVFGFPADTKTDLGAGCEGWIDASKPYLTFPWLQSSASTHTMKLAVPSSTSLVGLYVGMQTFVFGTNAPNGFDLTNAVFEVFGS